MLPQPGDLRVGFLPFSKLGPNLAQSDHPILVDVSERSRHRRSQLPPSVLASWRKQSISLRILRGFLGVTFLYAGIQKLADPGFFRSGSPAYIGAQLEGFSRGSPIGPLLHLLDKAPVLSGALVALTEIAIGLGALLGIGLLAASAAGAGLSAMLWLSASWHVHPYFLGSDSIYAVAWVVLFFGVWEQRKAEAPARTTWARAAMPNELSRREAIRGGVMAAATVAMGGVALALAGKPSSSSASTLAESPPASSQPATPGSTTSASGSSGDAATAGPVAPPPPPGVPIASLDRLQVGDAMAFDAPGVGPCALVRTSESRCDAFSRTCTHEGCEVGWNPSAGLLVCPCHGAEFDPAQGGKPVAGPTMTPLERVDVVVDRRSNQVLLPQ